MRGGKRDQPRRGSLLPRGADQGGRWPAPSRPRSRPRPRPAAEDRHCRHGADAAGDRGAAAPLPAAAPSRRKAASSSSPATICGAFPGCSMATARSTRMLYEANKDQIRNPDLIYPGQVFRTPDVAPPETIDPEAPRPADAAEAPRRSVRFASPERPVCTSHEPQDAPEYRTRHHGRMATNGPSCATCCPICGRPATRA